MILVDRYAHSIINDPETISSYLPGKPAVINHDGISVDLHLQPTLLVEKPPRDPRPYYLDPRDPDTQYLEAIAMPNGSGIYVDPGAFCLGASVELFNLPRNVSAQVSLKQTVTRFGLGQTTSGWVKPGFKGTLTLDLKNFNQYHAIRLLPNMAVAQLVLFKHEEIIENYPDGYAAQKFPRQSHGVKK